jgi:ABC-type nitrate/sulfonate/bicarbonate transport system permease component
MAALVPSAMLLVWELAVRSRWWPSTLIAPPSEVAKDFLILAANGVLLHESSASLSRLLGGFVVGSLAGIVIGALVGLSRFMERLLSPTLQLLAPVPPIAWIPLLIIVFGIGNASKVALIAIGAFFVVFLGTVRGIRNTEQDFVDLGRLYRKKPHQLLFLVLLPSAAPSIFTALRVAMALSWILLIAAEVIASREGLGWLIWDARNFSRPDDMIVGMIAIGILGFFTDWFLQTVERRASSWRRGFQGQ